MDDELERIKLRKMAEMLSRIAEPRHQQSIIDEPVELTDATFDGFISKYPFVVVDFWADWCAPCRAIAPIIKELAREYAGRVVFGKLNVDENPETTVKFGIMSIPTLMFFKGGVPVDTVIGAVPKRVLVSRISSHL
ncbi:MAG: thioredoxin [Nitrososphaerota archaeon]